MRQTSVAPKVNISLAAATVPGVSSARVDDFFLVGGLRARKLSSLDGVEECTQDLWVIATNKAKH